MNRVLGRIEIDFETGEKITPEQFEIFKKKVNGLMKEWELELYGAAGKANFSIDDVQPMKLKELDCEFEEYNY